MWFNYLRFWYLSILMVIFIYLNMPLLSFFFFLLRPCYSIWKLSFEQLIFFSIQADVDEEWLVYMDYDTDANFYFRVSKGEYYLWFNCYFFYYFYGGEAFISDSDFLDGIVYNVFDVRNFRHLYKSSTYYKETYDKDDYFFLYQFDDIYESKYNLKYSLKLLNKENFSVLNNADKLDKLNSLKKYYYILKQIKIK